MPTDYKLCSLNCLYCQYGWTKELTNEAEAFRQQLPSVAEIALALRQALQSHDEVESITFSGNGEPTLHPDFFDIVSTVKKIRDDLKPAAQMALLSNSSTCWQPHIIDSLAMFDLPIMKLDVGNEAAFKRLNHGIPPVTYEKILRGLQSLPHIAIQSMFVTGSVDNSSDKEVLTWIAALQQIKPAWVQIYSLDRGAASDRLELVKSSRLQEIARMAHETTGVPVEVY